MKSEHKAQVSLLNIVTIDFGKGTLPKENKSFDLKSSQTLRYASLPLTMFDLCPFPIIDHNYDLSVLLVNY